MGTNSEEITKEHLEKQIKQAAEIIAECEYKRITALTDNEEYDAIDRIGIWQNELILLERRYRKLLKEE